MANDAGPEAKQWALAATAILTTLTRREPRHDLLGGAPKSPEAEGTARTILTNSWSIEGRDKLQAALDWLANAGDNQSYQQGAAAFGQASAQQRQQVPGLAFINQYGTELGTRGLLAWDLGRLLAVAGWGYLAGYFTEDEAWRAIFPAATRLRATYTSWEEFGKHYRIGTLYADAASVGQVEAILAQLAAAPNSPWRVTPWRLDVPAVSSPTAVAQYAPVPATIVSAPPPGAYPQAAGAFPAPAMGMSPQPPAASPGSPAIVGSYDGVPVIAPPAGGYPPPPMIYPAGTGGGGGGGSKKLLLFGLLGGGGLVALIVLVLVLLHFHHEHEREEAERTRPREAPRVHEAHRPAHR